MRKTRTTVGTAADAAAAGANDTRTVAVLPHTSAAFSATLRVHLENRPGAFARMATAIGEAGGRLVRRIAEHLA